MPFIMNSAIICRIGGQALIIQKIMPLKNLLAEG